MMILIDGLLAAPVRGLWFLLRGVASAAKKARAADERAVMAELTALHRSLEGGQMTETAFDAREAVLLAHLDRLRGVAYGVEINSHTP